MLMLSGRCQHTSFQWQFRTAVDTKNADSKMQNTKQYSREEIRMYILYYVTTELSPVYCITLNINKSVVKGNFIQIYDTVKYDLQKYNFCSTVFQHEPYIFPDIHFSCSSCMILASLIH
jgi:hypothetical protein